MVNFGDRLKRLRLEKKLTQQELADDFNSLYGYNFSKPHISQYEHNKRVPEVKALKNFARYFNVSMDYLLGLSDIKNFGSPQSNSDKMNQLIDIACNIFGNEDISLEEKNKLFNNISDIVFKAITK